MSKDWNFYWFVPSPLHFFLVGAPYQDEERRKIKEEGGGDTFCSFQAFFPPPLADVIFSRPLREMGGNQGEDNRLGMTAKLPPPLLALLARHRVVSRTARVAN